MIYVAGSGYLAFKAYNGEEIKVDFLDQAWEALTGKTKKESNKNDDSPEL